MLLKLKLDLDLLIVLSPPLYVVSQSTSDAENPIVSNQNSPLPHNIDKALKNNFLSFINIFNFEKITSNDT